jgi:hypothetical protein
LEIWGGNCSIYYCWQGGAIVCVAGTWGLTVGELQRSLCQKDILTLAISDNPILSERHSDHSCRKCCKLSGTPLKSDPRVRFLRSQMRPSPCAESLLTLPWKGGALILVVIRGLAIPRILSGNQKTGLAIKVDHFCGIERGLVQAGLRS